MSGNFTSIVYKAPNVEIHYDNNFYSIKATKNLSKGHLVFIEHVLWGDTSYLCNGVARDDKLFQTLYPRPDDDKHSFEELLKRKTMDNCFCFDGVFVLGSMSSKFNHSCTPNCHLDIMDYKEENKFYGAWTHKNVKAGEELTFDYANTSSPEYHDKMKKFHNFSCTCSNEFILQNRKRVTNRKNTGDVFRKRDKTLIYSMVDEYTETEHGQDVSIRQKALRKFLKNPGDVPQKVLEVSQ
jgi:hypothetical protein